MENIIGKIISFTYIKTNIMLAYPIKCLETPIDVIASHASIRIYKYKTEQINTISKSFYNTNNHIYTLSDSS